MAQTTEPPSGPQTIAVCSASDKSVQHLPLGITRDATRDATIDTEASFSPFCTVAIVVATPARLLNFNYSMRILLPPYPQLQILVGCNAAHYVGRYAARSKESGQTPPSGTLQTDHRVLYTDTIQQSHAPLYTFIDILLTSTKRLADTKHSSVLPLQIWPRQRQRPVAGPHASVKAVDCPVFMFVAAQSRAGDLPFAAIRPD